MSHPERPLLRARSLPAALCALLLAVALVVVSAPTSAHGQSASTRLADARARLQTLSGQLAEAERTAQRTGQQLADADQRLAELEEVVNDAARAVEEQRELVDQAEQRLAALIEEAEELATVFAQRVAHTYKHGAILPLATLLAAEGPEDAIARDAYLRVVNKADQVSLERLDAAEIAVEAERELLLAEQEVLEETLEEQRELLAEAERLRESRALAAAQANDRARQLAAQRDDLQAEQSRLQSIIRREQEAARRAQQTRAAAPSGPVSSSGFAWPLCARVTSEYGMRWGRLHAGIDLGASTGTTVRASKAGTVIFAGRMGGYGNLVLVDHRDGVVTAYAHLSRISVSNGRSVSQGATVGLVGSTGNSTGPHLHFETRANGRAVNPRQYLRGSPC